MIGTCLSALGPAGNNNGSSEGRRNRLILGDNAAAMALLKKEMAGSIDLIYIDPPFGTGNDFHFAAGESSKPEQKAYEDRWGNGIDDYLQMMYGRLGLMKDLLSETGSIYVHLDYHACHYVKLLMDEIYGRANLVNQIIWQRTGAHNDPQSFGRNYDVILFYQKGVGRTWHEPRTRYDEAHRRRYFQLDEKGRWYRLNNPTGKGFSPTRRDFGRGPVLPPRDRHWSVTQDTIDRWIKEGRIVFTGGGYPFVKKYLDELPGRPVQSIWTDLIPPRATRELTGFPTQKPEKLLRRIIEASSDPGDTVADFFCGSGTTLAAAEKLGRRWIGCDISGVALEITRSRLDSIPSAGYEILKVK